MMGKHQFAPKLYYELSLDRLVPQDHLLRQISAAIDFAFVYPIARPTLPSRSFGQQARLTCLRGFVIMADCTLCAPTDVLLNHAQKRSFLPHTFTPSPQA